jgi:PAS domain S-box-containing protein
MTPPVEPRDEGGGDGPSADLFERTLLIEDNLLAECVRELADAVVISDPEGIIVFWNGAAASLFGWPAGDATGQSLDLIIPERLRPRHWHGYRRVMETGQTDYAGRLLEVPAVHRDGHTLSVAFTVTLLMRDGERQPRAVAAVIRDDTARWQERRRMRERLAALEAGDAQASTQGR